MQRFQKCDERGGLRGAQVLSVSRHVAAALDYLANELSFGEPHSDAVQCRASQSTQFPKRMTVAALLDLEYECALALQRCGALQKLGGHRIAAPRVHVRTPWGKFGEMRKGPKRHRDQKYRQNRDGATAPALFAFAGEKRQQNQADDDHNRANEKRGRLHGRRQQREQGVEPEEEIIRPGGRLDDCGIGTTGWSERTEVHGACSDDQEDESRKEKILPDRIRNEGSAVLFCEFVIFVFVGCA